MPRQNPRAARRTQEEFEELLRRAQIVQQGRRAGQMPQPVGINYLERAMAQDPDLFPAEPTAAQSYTDKISNLALLNRQKSEDLEQEMRKDEGEGIGSLALGTVGRVFDLLSRPNYAVAESQSRLTENQDDEDKNLLDFFGRLANPVTTAIDVAKNPMDVLEGAWAGFSGKKKTDFDQVLGQNGMAGGWQRATLGLGLDIATDPTTYTGTGIIAGTGKNAARTAAGKKVTKELLEETATRQADRVYRNSIKEELTALRKELGKKGKASTAQTEREIARRTAHQFIDEKKIDEVTRQIMIDDPSSVQFRFAGMPIYNSKGLYRAGRAAADKIGYKGSGEARLLNHAFNPNAEMPERLNELFRHGQVASEGAFARKMDQIDSIFGELDEEQQKLVNFGLDDGEALHHIETPDLKFGTNLEEYREAAKRLYKELADEELQLGIIKEEDLIENYTKRVYKKASPEAKSAANKIIAVSPIGPKTAGFQQTRKFAKSLRQLEAEGLKPVGVADSLKQRMAEHFSLKATHEFYKEAIDRFGRSAKGLKKPQKDLLEAQGFKLWKPGALKGNFKDTYLPEHIHSFLTTMDRINLSDTDAKKMLDHVDKVTGILKFGLTSMNPGFWMRNSYTDIMLNASDGVLDPRRYRDGLKVILNRKKQATAQQWAALGKVADDLPSPIKMRIGASDLSDEQVYNLFITGGAKSGYIKAELDQAISAAKKGGKTLEKVSKAKNKIMQKSEAREDYFRLVHFIDALDKEAKKMGKPVTKNGILTPESYEMANRAAARVRKFNIDYGNKTAFEKSVASRVIPFYTWARKNTALQISLLMTRPGVMAMYPKSQRTLQNILGTDENGETLVPQWIKELAPVRIATENKLSPIHQFLRAFGVDPGQAAVLGGQTFPTADLSRLDPLVDNLAHGDLPNVAAFAKDLAGESHPFLKAPYEAAAGEYLFSGAPINSPLEWLSNQIPVGRQAFNIGTGLQGGDNNWQGGLARYVSGLDIRPITEQMQQSEFRRREDALDVIIRKRREEELRRIINGA